MIARLFRSTIALAIGRYLWRNRARILARVRRARR
jgi:hypothetical protein